MSTKVPKRVVLFELLIGIIPLAISSIATWSLLSLKASYFFHAAILYTMFGYLLLKFRPANVKALGLGWANRMTITRAILSISLLAITFHLQDVLVESYWWIVGVSVVALSTDGLDGWIARITESESSFGARLDMEIDAFLLLTLSLLLFTGGKLGFWVLGIGLLRYGFGAAGKLYPYLEEDLPPSWRRKIICVVQGFSLLVCLAPVSSAGVAWIIAIISLGLLFYSFAVDVDWLYKNKAKVSFPEVLN